MSALISPDIKFWNSSRSARYVHIVHMYVDIISDDPATPLNWSRFLLELCNEFIFHFRFEFSPTFVVV